MNIKNRLKKIESTLNAEKSENCQCFENFIDALLDGFYLGETSANLSARTCPKCSKPVGEKLQNLETSISKNYGENYEFA